MPNSYVEISRTATDATYTLPSTFKYLSINDIHVMKINSSNVLTAVPESSISRSGNQITVNGISNTYPTLRFYRATTTTQQVDFVNGARLTEEQLDTAYRQSLYAAQEVTENAAGGNTSYAVNDIQASQLSSSFVLPTSKLSGTIGDNQLTSGVGTTANKLVKLDGSARLPAVDGSQLTNLPQQSITPALNLVHHATGTNIATLDIGSAYINSTYDDYFMIFDFEPATDGVYLHGKAHVGGAVTTGAIYSYEVDRFGSTAESSSSNQTEFVTTTDTIGGNATDGEGITGHLYLHNVNSTTRPCTAMGTVNYYTTSGSHKAAAFGGGFALSNRSDVVNGFRFLFSSGNIDYYSIKVYGIKK